MKTINTICPDCGDIHPVEDFRIKDLPPVCCIPCSDKEKKRRKDQKAIQTKSFRGSVFLEALSFAPQDVLDRLRKNMHPTPIEIEVQRVFANSENWALILLGEAGTYKTYCASKLIYDLMKVHYRWEDGKTEENPLAFAMFPEPSIISVTAVEIVCEYLSECGKNNGKPQSIMDKYVNKKLLVIDDLGCEKSSPGSIQFISELLFERHRKGMRTIITTNESDFAARYDERIERRLNQADIILMKGL